MATRGRGVDREGCQPAEEEDLSEKTLMKAPVIAKRRPSVNSGDS